MAEPIDIIARLSVDATGVTTEIDKVNAKYKESNVELKNTQTEINKLVAAEKTLLAERSKTNVPTIVAQFNNELKKNKEQLDKLIVAQKAQTTELKNTTVEGNKTKQSLDKAFDSTKTVSLREQIRRLKQDLANATDPAEIDRLAVETGKLQDKFQDASEAANVFSTESKFQSVGTALGNIGSKLLQLDFKGAADQSRLLATASSRITFKDALGGIKDLGTTLLNIGKSLLLNPLFLIGTTVLLIASNFDKLRNSSGLLGQAFKFVGSIIDGIKESFFFLTDAIGLTNHALEQFTENRIAQLNASFEVTQKFLQREIDIRKAAGKDTEDIEKKKYEAIIKNSKDQLTLLNKVNKDANDKQKNDLVNAAIDADTALKVLAAASQKKKEDDAKKAREKFLKDEEQKMEEAQREADRLSEIEAAQQKREFDRRIKFAEDLESRLEKEQIEELNERERHALAVLSINKASSVLQLQSEIEFEKERLDILKFTHGTESQEVKNQNDKLIELELRKNEEIKKLDKEKTKDIIANSKKITDALITASNQILAAKIKELDGQTQAQERRVEDATRLAEKGNAELLELEKKRLDDLTKEKEKFVRAQQALAVIQLVADTATTIAAAAAEGATEGGGVGAAVSIAAALIALIAGLASARQLAGQAAFYEGGYTGDGNPREQSNAVGSKPYIYHKGEFVHDHQDTKKYRSVFEKVRDGKVDLNDWENKVKLFESFKGMDLTRETKIRHISNGQDLSKLQTSMKDVVRAIDRQEKTKVVIDERGISIIASHYVAKQNRLNKLAS